MGPRERAWGFRADPVQAARAFPLVALAVFPAMPYSDDTDNLAFDFVPHVAVVDAEMTDLAVSVAMKAFAQARVIDEFDRRVEKPLHKPCRRLRVERLAEGIKASDVVRRFPAPSNSHLGRGFGSSLPRLAAQACMSSWLTVRPASISASPFKII